MICPIMSRPLQLPIVGDDYHSLGELLEVTCGDDCKARRSDGSCKFIDGKE